MIDVTNILWVSGVLTPDLVGSCILCKHEFKICKVTKDCNDGTAVLMCDKFRCFIAFGSSIYKPINNLKIKDYEKCIKQPCDQGKKGQAEG